MPVSLESILSQEAFLEARFVGAFDGLPFRYPEYLAQIFQACAEHQCRRVLLDHSRLEYYTDILVEHSAGESVARLAPRGVRLASVAPSSTLPHPCHFETVAVNRGVRMRVFWDREEALQWLLADEPAEDSG